MAPLTRLGSSLTQLEMECIPFPAALSALTRLQLLSIWNGYFDEAAEQPSLIDAINDTLPHLRQLTCLVSTCQAGATTDGILPVILAATYLCLWFLAADSW